MHKMIVISAAEELVCPKCAHHYPLDQGITSQTIERYEASFDAEMESRRKELAASMAKEAERTASRRFSEQIRELTEQLGAAKSFEQTLRAQSVQAICEATKRVEAEFAQEKEFLAKELQGKDAAIRALREQELNLRQERKKVDDERNNMALDLQRKLDEERKRIVEEIGRKEGERLSMIEAEYRKKIADAQRANEELRRKLEQGSQQLQGEVLELELEATLERSFRHDRISEVKKGQRGADAIQTVRTSSGQECGTIIWEAKRAENWSDRWLQKLKDDRQEARADIAVLVTTAMPRGFDKPFGQFGDIWVTSPHLVQPLAEALRVVLMESSRLKQVNSGRSEKMELLYSYLSSAQFAQRITSVMESFSTMRSDLESEKRAMQKIWAKREAQLTRVTSNMGSVVGELHAIAEDSLPQLEAIDSLAFAQLEEI